MKIEHFKNESLGNDGMIFCVQFNYHNLKEISFIYFRNDFFHTNDSTVALFKLKTKLKD
jgi:hypothetical protein